MTTAPTTAPDLLTAFADPDWLAGDRTEVYRTLRDDFPVLQAGPTRIVSRHADAETVLRDPTGRMQVPGTDLPAWFPAGPAARRLRANMVQTDGEVHRRLRGTVAPLFTARRSEELRAAAAAEVAAELDRVLVDGRPFDAVAELAARIPRGVLRLLIGMPDEDWALMLDTQVDFLMIFSPFPLESAQQARLDEVSQFYFDYFDGFLGRTTRPTPLVERLLTAESEGRLSRDEVLSLMHTVLDAGFETTRTSLSNLVEYLAARPELLEVARRAPTTRLGIREELLRLRAPVQVANRIPAEDVVTSDGSVLPAGEQVLVVVGAANTDERAFRDPYRMDPDRPNASRHLAFGMGLHHCLGAPLARIQLAETLAGLADRVSAIDLDGKAERHPSLIFPSLTSLPVRFGAR
ncbi:cytochrome P450 [Pseudonocardia halophobica]|uniref:Cytochrome P450 n=1 Tax=Pseudonocardia halophobica TaxID=29401 RepID=A0A9W6L302_9PSEU|nr:cytochrome P450 [Pseudonocardia halophobica]GLL12123.1 putative cytochrome P450 [Pseudonocardia halophobica]